MIRLSCFLLGLFSVVYLPSVGASERLVIEFSDRAVPAGKVISASKTPALVQELHALISETGKAKSEMVRVFGERALVVQGTEQAISQLEQRLQSDPAVAWTARDRRIVPSAQSPLIGLINSLDPTLTARTWHHRLVADQSASMNTFDMWEVTHGSAPVVVAVLDTGILLNHPMLQGHLVQGYDFVSDAFSGNDGQAAGGTDRDADPSDPGDGTTFADVASGFCSFASPSSWHGTFVAGLIAGNPVASEAVFPVGYNTTILPVRVLGRCGGFSTDLADAIRWSAGISVPGVPNNANPARIINMSLGAQGACVGPIEGAAIAAARNAGAVVIAAVGNDGSTVDTPANCAGVIGVSATDQEGLKANYSNFGSSADISAPGGDAAFPIWSSSNSGVAGPAANTYRNKIGSSFSSALVAGAAGTALAANPSLSLAQLENALLGNTRPFLTLNGRPTCQPGLNQTACNCTTATCGVGMLDAGKTVRAVATSPTVNLFSSTGNVASAGSSITFEGAASSGAAVTFELGSVVKSSDAPNPTLTVANNQATVTLPDGVDSFLLRASSGGSNAIAAISPSDQGLVFPSLIFGLLDSLGNATSADLGGSGPPVESDPEGFGSPQGSSDPAAQSGGGGGGGTLTLLGLLSLGLLSGLRRRVVRL